MKRLTMLFVCVLALGTLAACTDEGVKPVDIATVPFTPPITTTASSTTSTATSSSITSAPSSTTSGVTVTSTPESTSETSSEPVAAGTDEQISAQEAADRAAIEKVWREFWDVYERIDSIPPAEQAGALEPYSIDPIRTLVIEEAASIASKGNTGYGLVVSHPYWDDPVGGANEAEMGDCQDASGFGTVSKATGEVQSTGRANNNLVGQFVRSEDGSWFLKAIVYFDFPCQP